MRSFEFNFYFPKLEDSLKRVSIVEDGGHLGTAFKRAWLDIKSRKGYKGSKHLHCVQVGVTIVKKYWNDDGTIRVESIGS